MKLKNQNVNADGTVMLKNNASRDEENPTVETKVIPIKEEPVAEMEKPSKAIKEEPKERPVEKPVPQAKPKKGKKNAKAK